MYMTLRLKTYLPKRQSNPTMDNEDIAAEVLCHQRVFSLRPCLFPEKYFSGNHFPHFFMFGKHMES